VAESRELTLQDTAATEHAGRALSAAIRAEDSESLLVFLSGPLGAGKTTFVRGVLAGLGHPGRVPSPTYTLIEPYVLSGYNVYHIDLYRIGSANEVAELGLAELLGEARTLGFVEWPENSATGLPAPDLVIRLDVLPEGRLLTAEARTAAGRHMLAAWQA
jgi:tRNA threonylcarbamoyladenosine biosynthesis protein TsaE